MEAPDNLVEAVNRLKPRAVLLLDTNTIMGNRQIGSYEIAAQGRFLLVIPRIVNNQLMNISIGAVDQRKRRRAKAALRVIDQMIERGSLVEGIDIGNGRWLVTATVPNVPDSSDISLEDRQISSILGAVDEALIRLAEVCSRGLPDTPTLLITADMNLIRSAKYKGLRTCRLSSLRSHEVLAEMLLSNRPQEVAVPDSLQFPPLDPSEEQPVRIAMTLEEISSEDDYRIARGSGHLTYDDVRYPFRWRFPHSDIGKAWDAHMAEIREEDDDVQFYNSLPWDMVHDEEVMPVENLDYMSADERIPERVRRFACRMLEDCGLHPPLVKVRLSMLFLMGQGEWGPYPPSDHYRQLVS